MAVSRGPRLWWLMWFVWTAVPVGAVMKHSEQAALPGRGSGAPVVDRIIKHAHWKLQREYHYRRTNEEDKNDKIVSSGDHFRRAKRSYDFPRSKQHPLNSLRSAGGPALFLTPNGTTVAAQTGGTAKLPCEVRKFNNEVVSWIRKKDSPPTILTVGVAAYSADGRFLVEHARHLPNWGLVISRVLPSDAGLYECQVSTHPPSSVFVELKVQDALAEIVGAPDLHIKAGSTLRLVCALRRSTETPEYVFWYHEHKMINHEPGVFATADRSSSVLQIEEADSSHSGNYTCVPSNAVPASINVHVLNATEEENPAAMLHANSSGVSTALFMSITFTLVVNVVMTLDR